jgi:hypothetical protein
LWIALPAADQISLILKSSLTLFDLLLSTLMMWSIRHVRALALSNKGSAASLLLEASLRNISVGTVRAISVPILNENKYLKFVGISFQGTKSENVKLLIDGQFRESRSSDWIDVLNPVRNVYM